MNQMTAPYGSWPSPISSDLIAGGSVRLSQVALLDNSLYWLESRPTEGGRYALVRRAPDGAIEDVTQRHSHGVTGAGSANVRGDSAMYPPRAGRASRSSAAGCGMVTGG